MAPVGPRVTAQIVRLGLALGLLHLVLIQPNHPAAMAWDALFVLPLELPVIVFALVALGRTRFAGLARSALVAVLLTIAILKGADYAMFTALGRGFNPVSDLPLIEAGLRLSTGAIGHLLTGLGLLAALVGVALVGLAIWWATGVWSRLDPGPWPTRGAALVAVAGAGVATAEIGDAMGRWDLSASVPGAAFTARVGVERVVMARETLADLRAFNAAARIDPYAGQPGLLSEIDRDVLIIFVESYGRASFDTPLYAETHRATLAHAEERLAALGLAMRSGYLEAPTRGGQSWLSHATFANGLWIADQTSYGAALASGRQTLFHAAQTAGFHTAAVMPQITLEWPESAFMGFDTILAEADLGYLGAAFNWVTMPDQYTFSAMDRLLLNQESDRPRFVQMALGSSHAPWVPVPDVVDWDAIGDGEIFTPMAEAGDPPDVVWRDRDRVREQYRLALDYALTVVMDYIARQAGDPPLVFVIGDHQAAEFVARDDRPDVPIHLIGPAPLVDRAADWGWRPGLFPDEAAAPRRMDRMRDLILDAFSAPTLAGGGL